MNKQEIIKKFGGNEKDSGRTEVQIAILSSKIDYLTEHLKEHSKDHSSRRGLMAAVGLRKRLISYLKREDMGRYKAVIDALGIRK